jgi:hypothetical protein
MNTSQPLQETPALNKPITNGASAGKTGESIALVVQPAVACSARVRFKMFLVFCLCSIERFFVNSTRVYIHGIAAILDEVKDLLSTRCKVLTVHSGNLGRQPQSPWHFILSSLYCASDGATLTQFKAGPGLK